MLTLLLEQTVNDRLPSRLPQGHPVAHKTGNLPNLSCGDVGSSSPRTRATTSSVPLWNYAQNDAQTTEAMAALSRTVCDRHRVTEQTKKTASALCEGGLNIR